MFLWAFKISNPSDITIQKVFDVYLHFHLPCKTHIDIFQVHFGHNPEPSSLLHKKCIHRHWVRPQWKSKWIGHPFLPLGIHGYAAYIRDESGRPVAGGPKPRRPIILRELVMRESVSGEGGSGGRIRWNKRKAKESEKGVGEVSHDLRCSKGEEQGTDIIKENDAVGIVIWLGSYSCSEVRKNVDMGIRNISARCNQMSSTKRKWKSLLVRAGSRCRRSLLISLSAHSP